MKATLLPILFISLLLVACNQDIKNVALHGQVLDETNTLLTGVQIIVENATYEGGDDDSYNNYYYDTIHCCNW